MSPELVAIAVAVYVGVLVVVLSLLAAAGRADDAMERWGGRGRDPAEPQEPVADLARDAVPERRWGRGPMPKSARVR